MYIMLNRIYYKIIYNKVMSKILRYLLLLVSFFPLYNFADEINVSGLNKPVEIIIDKYGVPHIYAQDHYDVFFAQGFNAARDRLWQIDTWRRRGLGQLSEDRKSGV